MVFEPLDPDIALKAIEGYQNELEPERKAHEAFYRQFRCRRCGNACQKEIDPRHAFADTGSLVARCLLRCMSCRCLFDPHSGLLLEMGNLANVPPDIPLIGPSARP